MVRRPVLPALAPSPKAMAGEAEGTELSWAWLVWLLFLPIPGAGNTGIRRPDLEIKRGHVCAHSSAIPDPSGPALYTAAAESGIVTASLPQSWAWHIVAAQ